MRPPVWRVVSLFVRLARASRAVFILELVAGDPAHDANVPTKIKPMVSRCSIKAARCPIKGHHSLPYSERSLECTPSGGHLAGLELTGTAGLSEDEICKPHDAVSLVIYGH
jgi:hypothetical protein